MKKEISIKVFYHKSRYRGIDISQYGWTNISIPRPSSLLSEAFSQASRQRCLEIYTKPILVVRKNQESLFETFSKRSPPPSKNLSSLQKYIFPTVAILDISTKPNRSFSYSSRFSLFSPDSTGGGNIYDRYTESQRWNEVEDFSCIDHWRWFEIENGIDSAGRCIVSSEGKGKKR